MNKQSISPETGENSQAYHTAAISAFKGILASGDITHASFDIFDTFLLRNCVDPSGVYEKTYYLLPLEHHTAAEANAFVEYRLIAELKTRSLAQQQKGTNECHIEDIYSHFPAHLFGLPQNSIRTLARTEFQAECELCFVNPDIFELFQEARSKGIQVGFLSDTYWDTGEIERLLHSCAPNLYWDFLYASCDYNTGKRDDLFNIYQNDQKLEESHAVHIGDNPVADVQKPVELGFKCTFYPQASKWLSSIFSRETHLHRLIKGEGQTRLDHGLRTLRRRISGKVPYVDNAEAYGCSIIGPVLTAFDSLISEQFTKLKLNKDHVAIAFLARDGYLPREIWKLRHNEEAHYVEINRRTSFATYDNIEKLQDFCRSVSQIDRYSIVNVFKELPLKLDQAFGKDLDDQRMTGAQFARILPNLIDTETLEVCADRNTEALLKHLRTAIPNFDNLTDILLIDLGYGCSIQKALRSVFDRKGLKQRLHGVYLSTIDQELTDIDARDTVTSLLGGLHVPPASKVRVLKNIALIEQISAAPVGSVASYQEDGTVKRENDSRHPMNKNLMRRVQKGAMHFAAQTKLIDDRNCFPRILNNRMAIMEILARALCLPTEDETKLFGFVKHDVNLGTERLLNLTSPDIVQTILSAKSPLNALDFPQSVMMWPGSSFGAASSLHGQLYALYTAGQLCPDLWKETQFPSSPVIAFNRHDVESHHVINVTRSKTAEGSIRIRVPLEKEQDTGRVMIPSSVLPTPCAIKSSAFQTGETLAEASQNLNIQQLPVEKVMAVDMEIHNRFIGAPQNPGYILVELPEQTANKATVLTLTLTPFGGLHG